MYTLLKYSVINKYIFINKVYSIMHDVRIGLLLIKSKVFYLVCNDRNVVNVSSIHVSMMGLLVIRNIPSVMLSWGSY